MQLVVNAGNVAVRPLYDSMGYEVVASYIRSRYDVEGNEIAEQRLRVWKQFEP